MSDEAIVIGARDEATAILRKVQEQTQQMAAGVTTMAATTERSTKRMEIAFKAVAVAGASLTAIVTAVRAVGAIFSGGGAAVDAFNAQAAAVNGLRTALQLQGVAADEAIARHQEFASQLQITTNIGDEATLALMQQAAMFGIQDDQLQDVTIAAIGLSHALGISTDEALKKVNQAIHGNTLALAEHIPALKEAKTEAERLAIIEEYAANGMQLAADQTNTAAGMAQRASGAWGDLMEKVGELIAPFSHFANEVLATLYEQLQLALVPAIETVNNAFTAMRPVLDSIVNAFRIVGVVVGVAFDAMASVFSTVFGAVEDMTGSFDNMATAIDAAVQWAAEGVIWAITAIEVVLNNLPDVFEFAWAGIQLGIIGLVEDIKHYFTVALPTYIAYFSTTFVRLLVAAGQAAWDAVRQTAILIIQAFIDIANAPMMGPERLAKLGMQLAKAGARIGTEFTASVAPLPEIADRALTDSERQLTDRMGNIAGKLGEEFTSKYQERIGGLARTTREGLETTSPDLSTVPTAEPVQVDATNALSAVESRLLVRGRADDPIQSVADNTKATVEALQSVDQHMEDLIVKLPGTTDLKMQLELIG